MARVVIVRACRFSPTQTNNMTTIVKTLSTHLFLHVIVWWLLFLLHDRIWNLLYKARCMQYCFESNNFLRLQHTHLASLLSGLQQQRVYFLKAHWFAASNLRLFTVKLWLFQEKIKRFLKATTRRLRRAGDQQHTSKNTLRAWWPILAVPYPWRQLSGVGSTPW